METTTCSHKFIAEIDKITNGKDVKISLVLPVEDLVTLAMLSQYKTQGQIEFVATPLQMTFTEL